MNDLVAAIQGPSCIRVFEGIGIVTRGIDAHHPVLLGVPLGGRRWSSNRDASQGPCRSIVRRERIKKSQLTAALLANGYLVN